MGRYKTIRTAIVDILEDVQVSGSAGLQDVKTKPTTEFTGYPAATVLPQAINSEYITVAQNQRGYGFYITLYMPMNEDDWQTAVDNMLDLVDGVLDALDQSIDLNGACDFLRAVPMDWLPEVGPQGSTLTASIMAVAIKDVDVRL